MRLSALLLAGFVCFQTQIALAQDGESEESLDQDAVEEAPVKVQKMEAASQTKKKKDREKSKPRLFVSSILYDPFTAGINAANAFNVNFGMRLGGKGALQFGLSYRNLTSDSNGSDVDAGDPDDQHADDLNGADSAKTQAFYFGYTHSLGVVARTGLKLGLLLNYGSTESKNQDKTRVYSEKNESDFMETLVLSESKVSFYGLILRTEVEHLFTQNIAIGVVQDFVYELSKTNTTSINSTRTFSGGVKTGEDDPSKAKNETKGKEIRSDFQGIYLRVYF